MSQVSRYLDRRNLALHSEETSALLMCALCRALRRYALKLRRLELVGDFDEFDEAVPRAHSCGPTKEDCRMEAEKAARRLSPRARTMLDQRRVGFDWKKIARFFNTTDCAARAEFSREVKKAKTQNANGKAEPASSVSCEEP